MGYIFLDQLNRLQHGDRLYYLEIFDDSIFADNALTFSEIIMRNTGLTELPEFIFQPNPPPANGDDDDEEDDDDDDEDDVVLPPMMMTTAPAMTMTTTIPMSARRRSSRRPTRPLSAWFWQVGQRMTR